MEREQMGTIGIFDINFDTGERTWSHELSELFGISSGAPPDFESILQCVHPQDRRAFNAIAMEPFRPDCPVRTISEFRVVRADGSVHWLRFVRMSIFREGNRCDVVRVLGYVTEIFGPTARQRPWEDIAA